MRFSGTGYIVLGMIVICLEAGGGGASREKVMADGAARRCPPIAAEGSGRAGGWGRKGWTRGRGRGPQLPVGCDEFQSIPMTFWGNYEEKRCNSK